MTLEKSSIRAQVRDISVEEFAKAHNKKDLIAIAEHLSVKDPEGTKLELATMIYLKFPAPDPALRGKSDIDNPVAEVWALAHRAFLAALAAKAERPRRKDMVAAGQAMGIAFFTVRTQYQAWFRYTQSGTAMITADSEGAPKGLIEMLFPDASTD